MSRTRSRSLAPLLVVPLLCSGLLAGCGVSTDGDQSGSSPTTSPSPAASDSPTPTPTVTVTASPSAAPSPTAAASPSLTPDEALLTASQMPSPNDTVRWKVGRTGPVSSQSFGLCAKFDVLSIGAEQAVERRFTAGSQGTAGSDTAGQQVATFPDAATTARATKVLQSFHDSCAKRVSGTHVKVRPIALVPVVNGTGWWYLVSYVRNGAGHFHTFGVDVVGNRISLISMDHAGQDHNYPPGQDPMQLAVKAAAGKLG
jgi:hypothetical protein